MAVAAAVVAVVAPVPILGSRQNSEPATSVGRLRFPRRPEARASIREAKLPHLPYELVSYTHPKDMDPGDYKQLSILTVALLAADLADRSLCASLGNERQGVKLCNKAKTTPRNC